MENEFSENSVFLGAIENAYFIVADQLTYLKLTRESTEYEMVDVPQSFADCIVILIRTMIESEYGCKDWTLTCKKWDDNVVSVHLEF